MLRTNGKTSDTSATPGTETGAGRTGLAGLLAGLIACVAWGVLPLYFKALSSVSPAEVLSHRIVGTTVLLAALLLAPARRRAALRSLGLPGVWPPLLASTILLAAQWSVSIWMMRSGQLMQASLSSLVSPIVTALVGVVYLKERLPRGQWAVLLLGFAGVAALTAVMGQIPKAALLLAINVSGYALLKKITPVDGTTGLLMETALLSPLALGWLVWQAVHGTMAFGVDPSATALLLFAGLVTAIPLCCFVVAVQRLRMTTIGVLQFIPPTCNFLLGR
jgi:chloramphenicol-sensitive protein RarD